MLNQLSLRDFAVVLSAELQFGRGLTVISGETGAGKSLLVDALLWLSGARADVGMVRAGAARAELAAEFELADAPGAAAWLVEHELDDGATCQLRRVVKADGGSKAWINGRAATLGQLALLGEHLIGIHGQHEHQALLSRERQLALLDAFGRRDAQLGPVRELARQWQAAEREWAQLQSRGDVSERIGWLRHQLDELTREDLAADAIARLLAVHRRGSQAEALLQASARAAHLLGDEHGAGEPLRQALAALARFTADEPALAEAAQLTESARLQLAEAIGLLEQAREGFDLDPSELQQAEQRLSRLHELARKHRVTLDGLSDHSERLAAELDALQSAEGRVDELDRLRASVAAEWRAAAAQLSAGRTEDAAALGSAAAALMHGLGMAGGRFEVALEPLADAKPNPQGAERVEFLVSANPGQPPRPLRKVASGGELARIALAIQVATLGVDDTPTMVFDEVDAGIGGAVAEVVGRTLRRLGSQRQVLCVTHLPQVAAQGHGHYRVAKSSEAGETSSAPQRLDDAGRIDEIARMLGGVEVTAAVRTGAKQMLDKARRDDGAGVSV